MLILQWRIQDFRKDGSIAVWPRLLWTANVRVRALLSTKKKNAFSYFQSLRPFTSSSSAWLFIMDTHAHAHAAATTLHRSIVL